MTDQETETPTLHAPATGFKALVKHEWPYVAMLALGILGVALESITPGPMTYYWELLVPLYGVICFFTRLYDARHQAAVSRLLRIELLHWGAVFVSMQLLLLNDTVRMMNINATGLMLMMMVALGTFTAGAQIGSWRICLVGSVLALGVPFVAWLERATLMITLVAIAAIAVSVSVVSRRRHPSA
ncbi:MAG TPA: hypothetical protein VED87_12115 [Methylocystis sp.]|nr:hypothetical protein [Methylocystis sp.]